MKSGRLPPPTKDGFPKLCKFIQHSSHNIENPSRDSHYILNVCPSVRVCVRPHL